MSNGTQVQSPDGRVGRICNCEPKKGPGIFYGEGKHFGRILDIDLEGEVWKGPGTLEDSSLAAQRDSAWSTRMPSPF